MAPNVISVSREDVQRRRDELAARLSEPIEVLRARRDEGFDVQDYDTLLELDELDFLLEA